MSKKMKTQKLSIQKNLHFCWTIVLKKKYVCVQGFTNKFNLYENVYIYACLQEYTKMRVQKRL